MTVLRFLLSTFAALALVTSTNATASDIFVDATDCPTADTVVNGKTVKGTYADSCKLKPNKCVKTTEKQPAKPNGCKKRSFYDKNKGKPETETRSCAAWKACWSEKKKPGNGQHGGQAHTNVCNLSTVAKDWMSNQTPLIQDANEKLLLAKRALACVIDSTAEDCKKVNAAVKSQAATQFKLDNFGPASVQATNRTNARDKLTTAQENLFKQVGNIAKQYNATCRECSVLSNWHLVRTAVYFVNRTQKFDKATDKVGYASTKTTTTTATPPVTTTKPQAYEGRFAKAANSDDAYIIDNIKAEAFQHDDFNDLVLFGLKDLVCEVATATSNSKGQTEIAKLTKKLQDPLSELAAILKANTGWEVKDPATAPTTVADKKLLADKKKLRLGAKDAVRISGDKKDSSKKMCVSGEDTESYNLPEDVIDNTKMSASSIRSKFETLGMKFCSSK